MDHISATGTAVRRAAERLREAARLSRPCSPVRELIGPSDLDAAYAVQEAVVRERVAGGRRVVGHKIGLTSPAVQSQFGVFQPDFGVLLDDMAYADGEEIPLDRLLQPRVEAEVAFVLGRDVEYGATVAEILRATEFVLPAIEIVDSRIAGWDITITDTVADNASSGAFVLGTTPRRVQDVDLTGLGMVLEHGGEPASTGVGAACLGSPAVAATWLARELARRGSPLRAGEVVLSGALGPMVQVTHPGVYRARMDGLGEVSAVFADPDPAPGTEGNHQ
ncbi:2-keto-4-pentenoate hydratase [Streptomyces sp. NPDC051018]|uniref:2-keto-4-pentenoate hydratase n=1 Tax=Streptomyces sp. NPDC051018 TaxID=3365639 RepID=UPI0037A1EB81